MSCTATSNCTCGCCSGISVMTPQDKSNLPGLPAIAYRTGSWASFKESMLARLSSSDYPALAGLKTRDDDDFSIALLDASAVMLDILTFYQERLANESYLRTATQLRSLTELSRLIGYVPTPGVSASTYLAFTLKAATGLPDNPSTPTITIPQGTQAQSVPAQGQTPQTFETSADIPAKPDWNALPVQTGVPWMPPAQNYSLYLSGTSTQLNPGDSLLFLGIERETETSIGSNPPSEQWDVVILTNVLADQQRNITYVEWNAPLGHVSLQKSANWSTAKVFAFRQKAALFGNNAPSPCQFVNANGSGTSLPQLITTQTPSTQLSSVFHKIATYPIQTFSTPASSSTQASCTWQWNNYYIVSSSNIDLDAVYSKIVVGSWAALVVNGSAQLFNVNSTQTISRSDFAISGKVTELGADFTINNISNNNDYPLQGTAVFAQSEQLTVAEQPLDYPLYGTIIDLEELRPDLVGIQAVAITGKSQKLSVTTQAAATPPGITFYPDDSSQSNTLLNPGDIVTLIDPPVSSNGLISDWSTAGQIPNLRVMDASGRTGTLKNVLLTDFTLVLADSNDPVIQEFAVVSGITTSDTTSDTPFPHSQIKLTAALINCYDRTVTSVNANVAPATHGSSVSEIMGSGSAATTNQQFTLRQSPLTFVQTSTTPSGRLSTLQVTANAVAWSEVPSLYQQGPAQQVFSTLNQSDGTTDVIFGDGVEGATLPTGQNNIQANYRVGSGLAGNVPAGSITTLMSRPLGVSGVTNPLAATGGQDPQSLTDIRSNAPLSVLTLGRAVSITDYQNYASSFAGIAKAYAIWIPGGPGRGVFITVAAAGGAALPAGGGTLANLVASLQNYGNPLVPINAVSFLETTFTITADLSYDPAYDPTAVNAAVQQSLAQNYSFANRGFGQAVSADEVAAFIQAVPGVIAVNVTDLHISSTSGGGDIGVGSGSLTAYNAN